MLSTAGALVKAFQGKKKGKPIPFLLAKIGKLRQRETSEKCC